MSDDLFCPFCESNETAEVEYSEDVRVGRKRLHIGGLRKLICSHCGSESVPAALHDANLALVRAATEETQGAVTAGMLRTVRDTWGLTQREASGIFGAGISSFGKWESGQAKLSGPSALLIQVAIKFPHVVPYLAKLADVQITADSAGYRESFSETVVSFAAWAPPRLSKREHSAHTGRRREPPQWGEVHTLSASSMLEAA